MNVSISLSDLFLKLANMSISASWLVLVVLVLRLALKRAPRWLSVLLWGIVGVRLALPVSISSPLSLLPSAQTIPASILMDSSPAINTGVTSLNNLVNPIIADRYTPNPPTSANPLQISFAIWGNLWLLGMAALLLYTAVSYLRLRHRVRTAVRLRDNIYQCETVDSPFVLGLLRPRIYLPFAMGEPNMTHVIAHEQAHIRRRDHWWKPLGFLLLLVYWFNPLLWVAYILLCRDIEMACDESVVRQLNADQRADYSQALLTCSTRSRHIAACPLAFGEVGVKTRVRSVLRYKKPALWLLAIALVLCAVLAVCFLTDPVDKILSPAVPAPQPTTEPETPALQGTATEEWFNYYRKGTDMDPPLKTSLAELPGVIFHWTGGSVEAVTESETRTLFTGMPVWNAFFADLTGDGIPEICSTISYSSGVIGARFVIYDYAQDVSYTMEQRGDYDYSLYLQDGVLRYLKTYYSTNEVVDTGCLVYADDTVQMVSDTPEVSPLEAAISRALLSRFAPTVPTGSVAVESHILLASQSVSGTPLLGSDKQRENQITVYLLALTESYTLSDGQLRRTSGGCVPTALTFTVDEQGEYTLFEYWQPRDDSYYADDTRQVFPADAIRKAIDNRTAYLEDMTAANEAAAREALQPTDA